MKYDPKDKKPSSIQGNESAKEKERAFNEGNRDDSHTEPNLPEEDTRIVNEDNRIVNGQQEDEEG